MAANEQLGTRLAIVGWRNYNDYEAFKRVVDTWRTRNETDTKPLIEIVSGGASGTDAMAERYAREHRLAFVAFLADWKTHGKQAGPIRNQSIVERATHVLAFLHTDSRGTRNTISLARRASKPLDIVALQ